MMRALAVTGGIGSGKSFVVQMFAAMGVPVYDADSRTKGLYASDPELLSRLQDILGDELLQDGVLDRRYMASRIFSDRRLLLDVEAEVFPRVIDDFRKWKDNTERMRAVECHSSVPGFVILESAVYLEKPLLAGTADRVLTVVCPQDVRVERVMLRSSMSREEVLERMANQWDDGRRTTLSDFIIVSDFRHPLLPQVWEVYNKMNSI
ncbi:MAG TPA: dephospho-CoA kinase [Candidatus Coprenecus merdipullorum]|nr:dephospho-CoA kinase [Candidatus Coprenecus merdipullorum]